MTKSKENVAVGQAMRMIRNRSGKTLAEAAGLCGHTRSWLSDIESGRRTLNFDDAMKLMSFYGSTMQALSDLYTDYMKN